MSDWREFLDDDRYEEQPYEDSEQRERNHIAAILRTKRRQLRERPADPVAAQDIARWQRRAVEYQCYRRADRKWQASGRTPIEHVPNNKSEAA